MLRVKPESLSKEHLTHFFKCAKMKNVNIFLKKNPDFLNLAISVRPSMIINIPNATEEMQILAIKNMPSLLDFIPKPSENLVLEAIKVDFLVIGCVQEITENMVKMAFSALDQVAHLFSNDMLASLMEGILMNDDGSTKNLSSLSLNIMYDKSLNKKELDNIRMRIKNHANWKGSAELILSQIQKENNGI